MRLYRLGAYINTVLKVQLISILEYRKRALTAPVATRARDLLRDILLENANDIIFGKVFSGHIHMFTFFRAA